MDLLEQKIIDPVEAYEKAVVKEPFARFLPQEQAEAAS